MSVEAEQAVVASAIVSASQYDAVSEIITSGDILDGQMRCLWDATVALREAGRPVDEVILSAMLDRSTRWQAMGKGSAINYVAAIVDAAHSYKSAKVYAQIVKEASMTRRILLYAESVKEVAHDGEYDADQKLGEIHSMLDPLTENTSDGFATYKEATMEACESILAVMERGDGMSGLTTGFDAIDEITAGLQDSDLIYVGARPSMGKTVFAMCMANHVAKTAPVLVFSLEMPKQMLAKRTLSSFASIHMSDIMRGSIDEQDKPRLFAAGKQISELNLRIDDSAGLSVDQVRTRVRVAARKEKPRLIVLDYLTLMTGKGDNKHLEVSYISKSLKAMAKEMSCPVVCLAQLSRTLEQRPDKRPLLSDLRESGSIEEDADVVMFLYRDEVYNEESERKGVLEVNTAKNRNGEIGARFLQSELSYQRFGNLTSAVPAIEAKPKSGAKSKPLEAILSPNAAVNSSEDF